MKRLGPHKFVSRTFQRHEPALQAEADASMNVIDSAPDSDSEDLAAPGTAKCSLPTCNTRILPAHRFCCRTHAEEAGATEGWPPIRIAAEHCDKPEKKQPQVLIQKPEKDNWNFEHTEVESRQGFRTAEFPPPDKWKKRKVDAEQVWFVRPEDSEHDPNDPNKADDPMAGDEIMFKSAGVETASRKSPSGLKRLRTSVTLRPAGFWWALS